MTLKKAKAVSPEGREPAVLLEAGRSPSELCRKALRRDVQEDGQTTRWVLLGVVLVLGGAAGALFSELSFLQEEMRGVRDEVKAVRGELDSLDARLGVVHDTLYHAATAVHWTANDMVLLRRTLDEHFCDGRSPDDRTAVVCPFPLPTLHDLPESGRYPTGRKTKIPHE